MVLGSFKQERKKDGAERERGEGGGGGRDRKRG